jgi:predicted DNA-binding transcriptional regulator AlpA
VDIAELFQQGQNNRIARLPETCTIVGLSPSSVRNRIKKGGRWSDENFPKPVRLGTGKRCAIGWRVDELLAYLERQRVGGP